MSGIDIFYPIAPDLDWVRRLVPLGVRTIQLRLKRASESEIARQIDGSLEICSRYSCQLIINDHWQAALRAGADYVHLGQEDLATADVAKLKAADVRFGLSSHSSDELEVAVAAKPNYIALGPIWETKLKAMKWKPQGLERIAIWKARMGSLPLVAIAGITVARAPSVIAAGADSAAVITDIVTHEDPERRVKEWLAWADQARR